MARGETVGEIDHIINRDNREMKVFDDF